MIELSVIRDLVACFGVIAGFTYYVLTVRNAQKNQQMAEQNRQIQILQGFTQTEEDGKRMVELLGMEWKDYDEFERKYGSDNNPDNYAKRNLVWNQYNWDGYMLQTGLMDREMFFELAGIIPILLWAKFGIVMKEIRRRYNQPLNWKYLEYLAEEAEKYMQEKGIDTTVPDTYYTYVPDQ